MASRATTPEGAARCELVRRFAVITRAQATLTPTGQIQVEATLREHGDRVSGA